MTELARTLAAAVLDLQAVGVRFAVVGGLAVTARGEPRMTRDVDIVVAAATDGDAEALLFALRHRGWHIAGRGDGGDGIFILRYPLDP